MAPTTMMAKNPAIKGQVTLNSVGGIESGVLFPVMSLWGCLKIRRFLF